MEKNKPQGMTELTNSSNKNLPEDIRQIIKNWNVMAQILEKMPVVIYSRDKRNQLVYISPYCKELLGYSSEELLKDPELLLKAVHLDDQHKIANAFNETMIVGSFSAEYRLVNKKGHINWVIDSNFAVFNSEGTLERIDGHIHDISSRKMTEEALFQISKETTLLIDTANAPIFGVELNFYINEWNLTMEIITGYTKQEILGKNFVESFIPKPSRSSVEEILKKALKGEEIQNYELLILIKNNKTVTILLSVSTRQDNSGNIIGLVMVGQDITERKRVEAKQRELTAEIAERAREFSCLYNVSQSLAHIGKSDKSMDLTKAINISLKEIGTYLQSDRIYLFLLHDSGTKISRSYEWHAPAIMSLKNFFQDFPVDMFSWLLRCLEMAKPIVIYNLADLPPAAEIERSFFERLEVKSFLITPMYIENQFNGLLGIDIVHKKRKWFQRDIQFLKMCAEIIGGGLTRDKVQKELTAARNNLAEQVRKKTYALEKEKKRIEMILDAISDGIIVLNSDKNICMVNRTFQEYYQKIYGKTLSLDFKHFDSTETVFNAINRLLSANEPNPLTVEPTPGLYLQFSLSTRKFSDLGTIIEVRNVTPYVNFDNLRKEFVSRVSHELRTPISVITQSVDNLNRYKDRMTEFQQKRLWLAISKNTNLLGELIEDLLLVSRIDEKRIKLNWGTYRVLEVLQDVLIQLEPWRKAKRIDVAVKIDTSIQLLGDARRISQVFRILIDNALKYSPENSKIEINSIYPYKGKYNPENVEGVLIQVTDFGRGIRKRDLPYMFERFFRAESVQDIGGTGLGLSIAKDLISLHQGEIFVKSEYGKGSTFSVFLPRLHDLLQEKGLLFTLKGTS